MTLPSQQDDGTGCSLVWFRDDLRVSDNPALHTAMGQRYPVVALYVHDEESPGIRAFGGAARWWLHHSLEALSQDLDKLGVQLVLRRGAAASMVYEVARQTDACDVYWNRRYSAAETAVDTEVKTTLRKLGLTADSFQANLLHEPWTLKPATSSFYKVFTPFWKAALGRDEPRAPLPAPRPKSVRAEDVATDTLSDWALLPRDPDWADGIAATWVPGERGAQARLRDFVEHRLCQYARDRNLPAVDGTSMLSAHLRFGEISPFQVWQAARGIGDGASVDTFLSEIGWREFCWHLLHHNPGLASNNFNSRFDRFDWRTDPEALDAWQRGQTGFPIVDAGMRQLWETGWMHNRVRMIAASFLVKDLMIDWREGEAWFWDTLVDADAANNAASWQWVAGSGADAVPYFRVFNPALQAKKFDPDGTYVRCWIPELGTTDYPDPIVDHAAARERALAAYKRIKG